MKRAISVTDRMLISIAKINRAAAALASEATRRQPQGGGIHIRRDGDGVAGDTCHLELVSARHAQRREIRDAGLVARGRIGRDRTKFPLKYDRVVSKRAHQKVPLIRIGKTNRCLLRARRQITHLIQKDSRTGSFGLP